jgi:hypothetical protein
MPRSAVIYTSREAYVDLDGTLRDAFEHYAIKPYTLSHAQKAEAGRVRVRITELADEAVLPLARKEMEKAEALFASSGDRDVRGSTYRNLIDDADPSGRSATIQFVSPTMLDILGETVPFPVVSFIVARYIDVWNAFAPDRFPLTAEAVRHIHAEGFKISCVSTRRGPGCQGWLALEMERGRTEEYLRLMNALIDFAFYAGTGLHTDEGLGQTRRIEGKLQTAR